MTLTELIDRVLELDKMATRAPWEYPKTPADIDLIKEYRTAAVKLAKILDVMRYDALLLYLTTDNQKIEKIDKILNEK